LLKIKNGEKGVVVTENINENDDGITEVSPPEAENKLKLGIGISFSFNSEKFTKLQEESKKKREQKEQKVIK
jgi:hypothetical protein